MKKFITNPYFKKGLPGDNGIDPVSTDVEAVKKLLSLCPKAAETPLAESAKLSHELGIKKLWFKDERDRMGLGSFKALGAAFVIASDAAENLKSFSKDANWSSALNGKTYISASAGNHGISLAAGARIFGAKAVIYLSKNVPSSFADKIRSFGAEVVVCGNDYEESLEGAKQEAEKNGLDAFVRCDLGWIRSRLASYAGIFSSCR